MPPKPRSRARGTTAPRAARPAARRAPRAPQGAYQPRHGTTVRVVQAQQAAKSQPASRPDPVTVREAAARGRQAAAVVTERRGGYSGRGMLTAELLIGIGIVAIRAVADYEPQADGTLKGKIGHPDGQYGPLPILAGLVMVFFLLSFLAAAGGTKAKVAVIAGGIIDLTLLLRSSDEFATVAGTFGKLGHARKPAGSWQTSGTVAGEPIDGGSSSSSSGGNSPGARVGEPGDPNLLVPKQVKPM